MTSMDEFDQRGVGESEEFLEKVDGDDNENCNQNMSFTSKLFEIVSEERNREIVSWHRGMCYIG